LGNTTPPPVVTGVPEPEEWLLIGLALAALGWVVYKRRREPGAELLQWGS
jgi:hypothetical protein